MDRLTNRLLVIALPLVGFTLLGRGIASFTSGDRAGVRAMAAASATPVQSLAPPTQSSGDPAVMRPRETVSMRRLASSNVPSSTATFAGPPSAHERQFQRLDDLPDVERLDSLPEVERIYSETQIRSMHQSMVGQKKPTMFRIPTYDDPTLFTEKDDQSEKPSSNRLSGPPSVKWVAAKPRRHSEEPARSKPLELINPHLKATSAELPDQPASTSSTRTFPKLMRLPTPESISPGPSTDRSLEPSESPTVTTASPMETSRDTSEFAHEHEEAPLPREQQIEPSNEMSDAVSNNQPVADGRESKAIDDSRFASRYDDITPETTQLAPETLGLPRARDPQQAGQASSAPENDQAVAWHPVDLRTMELSADVTPSKPVPPLATTMSADKTRVQEALQSGFELARQRSYHSSHDHFIEALQIVAQSLDTLAFSNEHTVALRRGLLAYDEAVDFQRLSDQPGLGLHLSSAVSRHGTPVLHHANLDDWNGEQCLREYMAFAEREIVRAVGRDALAAQALYGLGRLQAHLQADNADTANVRNHRALMLYQTALLVDQRHYSAANELGVLLVHQGRLEEAVAALQHCVRLSPQPTAWQNLAVVHWRLGQDELARLADKEALMADRSPSRLMMAQ